MNEEEQVSDLKDPLIPEQNFDQDQIQVPAPASQNPVLMPSATPRRPDSLLVPSAQFQRENSKYQTSDSLEESNITLTSPLGVDHGNDETSPMKPRPLDSKNLSSMIESHDSMFESDNDNRANLPGAGSLRPLSIELNDIEEAGMDEELETPAAGDQASSEVRNRILARKSTQKFENLAGQFMVDPEAESSLSSPNQKERKPLDSSVVDLHQLLREKEIEDGFKEGGHIPEFSSNQHTQGTLLDSKNGFGKSKNFENGKSLSMAPEQKISEIKTHLNNREIVESRTANLDLDEEELARRLAESSLSEEEQKAKQKGKSQFGQQVAAANPDADWDSHSQPAEASVEDILGQLEQQREEDIHFGETLDEDDVLKMHITKEERLDPIQVIPLSEYQQATESPSWTVNPKVDNKPEINVSETTDSEAAVQNLRVDAGFLRGPEEEPSSSGAKPEEPDPEEQEVDAYKIQLVQATFQMIKDKYKIGLATYKVLFEMDPSAKALFKFEFPDNLHKDPVFHKHNTKFTNALSVYIKHLGAFDRVSKDMRKLASIHYYYKIRPEHFALFGRAFLHALGDILGEANYNSEIRSAWEYAYNLIVARVQRLNKRKKSRQMRLLIETLAVNIDDLVKNANSKAGVGIAPGEVGDESEEEFDTVSQREISRQLSKRRREEEEQKKLEQEKLQVDEATSLEVREIYLARFRETVDFHHKVAYRFERAFRLRQGNPRQAGNRKLNLDIIDCISEHSGYLEQDPLAVFYCMFFCIFYFNEDLIEFFRALTHLLPRRDKVDKMLEYIDVHGMTRLRNVSEHINQIVYHEVMYQAFDDQLHIVYSMIMKHLRFIQLRDSDALHLINTRDYSLIKLTFNKYAAKISLTLFFEKAFPMKCSTYRKYDQAYYEEVIVNSQVEPRVAKNYRERFLVTPADILIVFQMYCKEDYEKEFRETPKGHVTREQFIDLFLICIRNDSMKIALLIYLGHLKPSDDMSSKIFDTIITSIRETPKFHEIKLLFIHNHFDKLSILQMTQLLDTYQLLLSSSTEVKSNPIVSQFNTIKVSLLIYRICWKIEQRSIYSLVTKCELLQKTIVSCLTKYFESLKTILVLHAFMKEPILHLEERKDSLDIMNEMNMQTLLRNSVVVEVLDLTNEGRYSISSSITGLFSTFACLTEVATFGRKSLVEYMREILSQFVDAEVTKQSSIQYHFWKQCIDQRESDHMLFSILFYGVSIFMAALVNRSRETSQETAMEYFGMPIADYSSKTLRDSISPEQTRAFCNLEVTQLEYEGRLISFFELTSLLGVAGSFTTIVQHWIQIRFLDNVQFLWKRMMFEGSIIISGLVLLVLYVAADETSPLVEMCREHVSGGFDEKEVSRIFNLRETTDGSNIAFNSVITLIVFQSTYAIVTALQKSSILGDHVVMLSFLLDELLLFVALAGGYFLLSWAIAEFMKDEFLEGEIPIVINLFAAMNGQSIFQEFTVAGQTYLLGFIFVFRIFFLGLAASMLVNRYQSIYSQIEAIKRFEIIRLKNSNSYNKFLGGATIPFFPFNIVTLPFLIPIVFTKSPSLSEMALKLSYYWMMALYGVLGGCMMVVVFPLIYLKIILNAVYTCLYSSSKDQFPGQKVQQLFIGIALGPLLITGVAIRDLVLLPATLMKEPRTFEHKYQMSSNQMNTGQAKQVLETFQKIFFGKKSSRELRTMRMTLMELMEMHRHIFKIVENLHDFFCKGTKDYQEALGNVEDFNMTKIFTSKCSVPAKSGKFKEATCEIDLIFTVVKDVHLFNYADNILRLHHMGELRQQISEVNNKNREKRRAQPEADQQGQSPRGRADTEGGSPRGGGGGGSKKDKDKKNKKIFTLMNDPLNEDDEPSDDEFRPPYPTGKGPNGVTLHRNQSNLINNFHIHTVAEAFSEISIQRSANMSRLERKKKKQNEFAVRTSREMLDDVVFLYEAKTTRYVNMMESGVHYWINKRINVEDELRKIDSKGYVIKEANEEDEFDKIEQELKRNVTITSKQSKR